MLGSILFLFLNAAAAADFQIIPDIPYVPHANSQHNLDLIFPPGPHHALIPVILLHGGCFNAGDKKDMVGPDQKGIAVQIVEHLPGFMAIAANYTLDTPTAPSYPKVLEDLKNLIDWVHSPEARNYGIDGTHIVAYGESAGATLAGYLGTRSLQEQEPQLLQLASAKPRPPQHAAVEAVIDFYGRTDFTLVQAGGGVDCPLDYIHSSREAHLELFKEASVAPEPGIEAADFLIVHGLKDRQVAYSHSVHLAEALRPRAKSVDVLLIPDTGHGFDKDSRPKAWSRAFEFLQRHFRK